MSKYSKKLQIRPACLHRRIGQLVQSYTKDVQYSTYSVQSGAQCTVGCTVKCAGYSTNYLLLSNELTSLKDLVRKKMRKIQLVPNCTNWTFQKLYNLIINA